LLDDALLKVSQGITTMEEVARVVPVDLWRLRPAVAGAQTQEMPDAQTQQTQSPLEQPPASLPWRPQWAASAHERAAEAVGDLAGDSPVERDAVAAEAASALAATPEPAGQTAEATAASPASTPSEPITSHQTERDTILVVDDSEEILQLVSLALEDEYNIALARDGIEALQEVEAVNPTLLVLDVMLPRLSGYDVCLKLKEDPRTQHLPILMLSARGEKQAIVKGFYAGADDYLPKPFDPEELLLRISALIRRYKAH
jgi:CheY-like chemotaxis protein